LVFKSIFMTEIPFHLLVRRWFAENFTSGPTAAQQAGWAHIAGGRATLIAAPTGSGKTLAAFLWSINRLVERGLGGGLEDRTSVVYVSPQGAGQRHREESACPARRHHEDCRSGRSFPATPGDSHRRALGRYARCRAAGGGPPAAAHPYYDAGVALHPAHVGERQENSQRRRDRDRG